MPCDPVVAASWMTMWVRFGRLEPCGPTSDNRRKGSPRGSRTAPASDNLCTLRPRGCRLCLRWWTEVNCVLRIVDISSICFTLLVGWPPRPKIRFTLLVWLPMLMPWLLLILIMRWRLAGECLLIPNWRSRKVAACGLIFTSYVLSTWLLLLKALKVLLRGLVCP